MSTSSATHRSYSFAEFTLDVDRGALLSAGADIKLRPKSFEVLSYLVERHGRLVTKDELLNALWGHTVVTEDSVTQCLIDIRRAIRDQSQKMIRTVPRRGYIFDLPVTKHGDPVRTSDAPSRVTFESGWPRWRLAAALGLMLLVVAVWWGFGNVGVDVPVVVEPRSAIASPSIAVLPFLDMSPEQDQEYFADGISEEVLNLLARIPELRVIARTSSFSFKGQNVDVATITERLNVTHVLEGSVRKSSNRIRITVQLVNASTSEHLWSETYDRTLDDIFAIQDEISANVVEQLKITILGDLPRIEQIDPYAYSLYLRAKHIVHGGQWDKLALAEQLLNEALAIEPDYVPALNALAMAYLTLTDSTHPSNQNLWRLIRNVAARVSAAEPEGVSDLVWRAWISHRYDNDPATAAPLYERALALDPGNLATLRTVTDFLRDIGYIDEAITTAEYVALRDPACVYCLHSLSHTYRAVGQFDKAIEILQDAVAWSPDRQLIYWALGSVLLQAGRPAEALDAFEKEKEGSVEQGRFGRIFALHDLGRMEEFEQEFAELRADDPDNAEGHARIYAWTGNNDLALQWLEKFVGQEGPEVLRNLTSGGFYVNLESDSRFDELLHRHGQHPDQQEKIQFKFTPPE